MAQPAYSRLRAEAATVLGPPWRALRAEKLSAFPIALACTALIGLFALIQHTTAGWWVVEHAAGVYQALPLPLILLRLPLSMLAPAPDLPAWGAMVQVLVVFALSETHLGRTRTLVTAVCVNGLTTVSARVMVIVGLHLAIGTPQVDQYELDTGPSTVVVALSIYVALKCRAYLILAITAAAMGGEAIALPNLAGREHLVALGLGVAAYLIGERPHLRRRSVSPPAVAAGPAACAPTQTRSEAQSRPRSEAWIKPQREPHVDDRSRGRRESRPETRTQVRVTAPTASSPQPPAPDAVPPRPTPRP